MIFVALIKYIKVERGGLPDSGQIGIREREIGRCPLVLWPFGCQASFLYPHIIVIIITIILLSLVLFFKEIQNSNNNNKSIGNRIILTKMRKFCNFFCIPWSADGMLRQIKKLTKQTSLSALSST